MNDSQEEAATDALIAALRRDMAEPADPRMLREVSERLGGSLGLGPDWAASIGQGSTGASLTAGVGVLQPLTVLVVSAALGTAGMLGISKLREPVAGVTRVSEPMRAAAQVASSPPSPPPVESEIGAIAAPHDEPPTSALARARTPRAVAAPSSAAPAAQRDAVSTEASLGAQQALLDSARRALARGDGAAALEALGWHVARFPRTMLEEEREALTVKALGSVGRPAEAREQARRFAARYPASVFLPSLGPALEENP